MDAGTKQASIAIVLSHNDINVQQLHYSQFLQLRSIMHNMLGEEWNWHPYRQNEHGKTVSKITMAITNVNISRNGDWPALISFFKPRMMALDAFWDMVKYGFEM